METTIVYLPAPRGVLSEDLFLRLSGVDRPLGSPAAIGDPIADDDLQLCLWVSYELHYRGFEDVAAECEWDLEVLRFRAALEQQFEAALRSAVPAAPAGLSVTERLKALVAADDGPQLSSYLERHASRAQFEEFVIHRSIYHLKEADPHSWGIPRLSGPVKAALVTVQADEYGGGMTKRMHSELFRATMLGLGLDDSYGHYLEDVPGVTLAVSNVISLFGLHRRLLGALVGHLAAFEMTSSIPNRRYSRALRRLGGDASSRQFYDEHVTADALHEQLAAYDLCGGLIAEQPELAESVLFGAACALHIDARFAGYVLGRWNEQRSSLRTTAPTVPRSLSAS